MYHNKLNKNYRDKEEYGSLQYGYSGKPVGDDHPEIGISLKSLKNLPKSSYSVMADPYTAALPGSEPYAVLNTFNRTIGGFYGGDRNIDGGNVQQYSNSLRSKFLHAFDFARLKLGINYHYIPVNNIDQTAAKYRGKSLIDEQLRSIAEATSVLQSTTFTQMAIYDYAIATDMPMGSSFDSDKKFLTPDGEEIPYYDDLNDVIYASTKFYQIFWLKILGVFDWHNSFRLKMGTMIRSSWNRETARLNSLFGLFKKKSFLSIINSMAMSLPGEYIDREFALQFAKTCLVPSRRANALTEPVLETQIEYNTPNRFILILKNPNKVINDGEVIFDSKTDLDRMTPGLSTKKTFNDAVSEIMDLLSAEDTMKWARYQESMGSSPAVDTERFNSVKARFDILQACITVVKTKFTDIREVLDTVSRTGLITWYKGFRPSIVKDDDAGLFRNLIVDDIYKLAFSGATEVVLDYDTKRFKTFTFWNMYDGIPEYDVWSGGAFLTFSLKNINDPDDDPDLLINYMPSCLTYLNGKTSAEILAVNRIGSEYVVTTKTVQLSQYVGTRRLVPLESQDALEANIASITPVSTPNASQATDYAFLSRMLVQVTGMCYVDTQSPVIYQDPDLLAIYQIEIEDISNEMIAYARVHSPFKGAVSANSKIGFLGTVAAGSRSTKLDEKMSG